MIQRRVFSLSLLSAPLWLAQQRGAVAQTGGAANNSTTSALLSWKEFIDETAQAVEALYADSSPAG